MCLSLACLWWPSQLQARPNTQSIDNRYGNDNIEILSHNSDDRHPYCNSFSSLLPQADVTYCSFVSYYLHPWYNSEKFYGQGKEHGLVRYYPVNNGWVQLVKNKQTTINLSLWAKPPQETLVKNKLGPQIFPYASFNNMLSDLILNARSHHRCAAAAPSLFIFSPYAHSKCGSGSPSSKALGYGLDGPGARGLEIIRLNFPMCDAGFHNTL